VGGSEAVLVEEGLEKRIEEEVGDVVGQRAADQELERHVVDALGVEALIPLLGLEPALRQHVADRARDRLELVARRRGGGARHLIEGQVALEQGVLVSTELHAAPDASAIPLSPSRVFAGSATDAARRATAWPESGRRLRHLGDPPCLCPTPISISPSRGSGPAATGRRWPPPSSTMRTGCSITC